MLLRKNTPGKGLTNYLHSDRISLFWFHSTTLTPPGPQGVSREAKLSTEFNFVGFGRLILGPKPRKFEKLQKLQD